MCQRVWRILKRRYIRILIAVVVLYILINSLFQPVEFIFIQQHVNTTCILPDLNPFDKSVMKYVYHPKPIECDPTPSLVYIDAEGMLQFNTTITDKLDQLDCSYRIVKRNGENDVTILSQTPFIHPVYIPSDCINVKCMVKRETVQDIILYNIDYKSVMEKKKIQRESNEQLNLFMFGFDSVSRLAAERKLPKTMNYIRNKLKGHTFKGYTMIGGNTYPNLIPVLTGKTAYSSELPPLDPKTEFTDRYPFIWKEFARKNYATMYSEDYPEISIFDNNMKGFKEPPADHYLRTYVIAKTKINPIQSNIETFKVLMFLENKNIRLGKYSPLCYKDKPKHVRHINHYKKFITTYKKYRKFAFSWLTEISHEFMNFLEHVDDDTMQFFKSLFEEGHLNNSVLVFMSDHGPRNDEIRNTATGRVEERMPLLSIIIPEHIKRKYPHLEENLQTNENRLTSPYDLHETLMDIANSNFKKQNKINIRPYPRGISLFRSIPKDRSCADALIAEHFCACYTVQNVTVQSSIVKALSEFAVNSINSDLASVRSQCSKLSLYKILEAQQIESGLQHQADMDRKSILNLFYRPEMHKEQRYLILFQTSPGFGLFEATVSFKDINDVKTFKLLGDVSRTNKYKNQSHCVGTQKLKPICYCKHQIQ